MNHHKQTLLLTAALFGGGFASGTFAQEILPETEAVEVATQTVVITGKMVLPKNFSGTEKANNVDISKLTGTFFWLPPNRPNLYPEGHEKMTAEEKKAWYQAFRETPESIVYKRAMHAWTLERDKQKQKPLKFETDGSFSFKGLAPGKYLLKAYIPHPQTKKLPAARFHGEVEVEAKTAKLEDLELSISTVLVTGDIAPDFTAQYYDGTKFQLSDYRGKYVLLDFWATWCGPCIKEMPNVKAVYEDFAGDQFEVISLSLDSSIDLPKKFHEKRPAPYVHGYLGKTGDTETATKDYGIRGIPSVWLIGPDGKIVARDLRGEKLREAVRKAVEGDAKLK